MEHISICSDVSVRFNRLGGGLGPRKYIAIRLAHFGPRGLATNPFLIRYPGRSGFSLDQRQLGVPTRGPDTRKYSHKFGGLIHAIYKVSL